MFPFWYLKSFLRTKHRKGDCVSFQEGGPPCEDCDLEGHTALCGWHRDWHRCDCGGLEMNFTANKDTISLKNLSGSCHEVGKEDSGKAESR